MRVLARLLLAMVFAAGLAGIAGAQSVYEYGRDRPGGDYTSFTGTPGPVECAQLCASQVACKSWTWINPGVVGPQTVCRLKNTIPARTSNGCCTSGVKLIGGPLPPGASIGRDRPGNDYSNFALPGPNPKACADACAGDPSCRAWTYANPGTVGPQARCYLKNPVPAEVANTCCISGVVLPPPPPPLPPGAEFNKDRPGNDFSTFALATPNPALCANACQGNPNCMAWTFAKPGTIGPQAVCSLKNPVPAAVDDPCCISGVKAGPPPPPLPPGAQNNRDRPGNDFSSFPLATPNPSLCYNACQGNANCLAWSYARPGTVAPQAYCYLKNPAPPPIADPCCISGAKAAPPPPPPPSGGGPFEININRPGGDYIDFASGGANTALLCLAACQTQPACRAWTYVKPGFMGPQSHCWLKSTVPPAQIDNCCVSGVKP